ncbi:polysaccharide pyruvyl transferase family protein [Moorena sp. SIO4G3]|uniref:polysaccharide pyruvyl transferase family protein n=1 Tax=Moorena sp. SIO4G3 TaxID=2607821 RepID=UPI00142AB8A7|nr:polysaccharide pyruvyl transferase family protein [Moorena sp. SIO4G3]NEO80655.1 polysaccharide polymerase [Moorena sp. SIO4G3]
MTISTPENVKEVLHKSLGQLDKFEECILLDNPDHYNIGDHLIWLGSVLFLTDTLKTKIKYATGINGFSDASLKKIDQCPIIFNGGGALGDLYEGFQNFRESIIENYRDRPIIIFPQTIYFRNPENLKKAAKVFNSHPNLTLFTRDQVSYEIALKNFWNCQVIKSPDMAFQMAGLSTDSIQPAQEDSSLYLCRKDQELKATSNLSLSSKIKNLVLEDWVSDRWTLRTTKQLSKGWYWRIPGLVRIIREVYERGLATPKEWLSRQNWKYFHTNTAKFQTTHNSPINLASWGLMHSGIYQFKRHRLIITNRLHGHILSTLLEIPHIFLPNSYYKNEAFYEAWTSQIPFCRFIKERSELEVAVEEMLDYYPLSIGIK